MKRNRTIGLLVLFIVATIGSCTKEVDITIPPDAEQVVVEGSIENNSPPVVLLTRSAGFFDNLNLNNLGSYFIRGAAVRVTASDGTETELVELCLQNLNLPPDQSQIILDAFGFSRVDSASIPDICVYTVPDITAFFLTGTCQFMGKERTTYQLHVTAPPLRSGQDSVIITSSTYIPTAIGIDSLSVSEHPNEAYRDSFMVVYVNFQVPDTFGNYLRYQTKRNNEPFYKPRTGSVYDDRLFVGLNISLPVERGQPRGTRFDINTNSAFWRGDTVTVKWSNIDNKTYDFFYTLENDGGDSPFSSPVKIKTNINNGLGIWAGYASKYYTVVVPE